MESIAEFRTRNDKNKKIKNSKNTQKTPCKIDKGCKNILNLVISI